MKTLSVPLLRSFSTLNNTKYHQPEIIGVFSYDAERNLHLDSQEALKPFTEPTLPIDLNKDFESFKRRDETTLEHLDALLECLDHKNLLQSLDSHIITWRGIITKIMMTPFDRRSPYSLHISKFKVTLHCS